MNFVLKNADLQLYFEKICRFLKYFHNFANVNIGLSNQFNNPTISKTLSALSK